MATCLPAGGTPRNSSWWVPRPVQRSATRSSSAISSSWVEYQSGNAPRKVIANSLKLSLLTCSLPGRKIVASAVISSSAAAVFPWLQNSSTKRLTTALFSSTDMEGSPLLYFSSSFVESTPLHEAYRKPCRGTIPEIWDYFLHEQRVY